MHSHAAVRTPRTQHTGWSGVLHRDSSLTDDQRFDRLNLMLDASNSVIEAKVY